MNRSIDKFQELLRELFQFDCADLDFGIYRVMNFKRGMIEKFIMQDLPRGVAAELERGTLADQSQAAKELTEAAQQIKETLGMVYIPCQWEHERTPSQAQSRGIYAERAETT